MQKLVYMYDSAGENIVFADFAGAMKERYGNAHGEEEHDIDYSEIIKIAESTGQLRFCGGNSVWFKCLEGYVFQEVYDIFYEAGYQLIQVPVREGV